MTKAQIAQLSKWANEGRLVVRPITSEELPEWAKHDFILARRISALLMEYADSGLLEAKSTDRMRRYSIGGRKGWETRKKQAAARSEAGTKTQEKAA